MPRFSALRGELFTNAMRELKQPVAITIEHVEERGQTRLSKTIPGEPELPNGGSVREYSPPRRQQSRQTGVSDAAIREVPRGDLHDMEGGYARRRVRFRDE